MIRVCQLNCDPSSRVERWSLTAQWTKAATFHSVVPDRSVGHVTCSL